MSPDDLMAGLPGETLVRQGLADFQAGRCSIQACLVTMASPRLGRAGWLPPAGAGRIAEPELQLYRLLRQQGGDAYSRYNAWLRELVSFEQALDRRKAMSQLGVFRLNLVDVDLAGRDVRAGEVVESGPQRPGLLMQHRERTVDQR